MLTSTQIGDERSTINGTRGAAEPDGALLAADVQAALRAAPYVPPDAVDIEVRGHAVYLSGLVKWGHQRVAAERTVERLPGVRVLHNGIRVIPRVSAAEARSKILAALHYDAADRRHRIDVDVDGESVVLSGVVGSYSDRRTAGNVIRSMPHVRTVCNRLRIAQP